MNSKYLPFYSGFFGLLFLFGLPACKSNDKSVNNNEDPGSIYFDYQVAGSEEDDSITLLFQFRNGDIEGEAFRLDEPSKVTLDGDVLAYDSSKMTGYYYEIRKPSAVFAGEHNIVFTDINGRSYREDFTFRQIGLVDTLGEISAKDSIFLHFSGLEKEDYMLVLMTDTTFPGRGINRVDTIINGKLVIPPYELNQLAPGPVQIMFTREFEKPLENATKSGGRLLITYRLVREFILKD